MCAMCMCVLCINLCMLGHAYKHLLDREECFPNEGVVNWMDSHEGFFKRKKRNVHSYSIVLGHTQQTHTHTLSHTSALSNPNLHKF